tara:strand:+ start:11671 stop:11835 length:165 start_codon:yes stop_codon:yes gene_type:complete
LRRGTEISFAAETGGLMPIISLHTGNVQFEPRIAKKGKVSSYQADLCNKPIAKP